MSLASRWVITAFVFSSSVMAMPQCETQNSKILGHAVNWCFERSRPEIPASAGEPVVYFMHGLGGSAKSWAMLGYSDQLLRLRGQGNYPPVTFVSFDTAENSMFSDFAGVTSGPQAYETWFIEEFIPFIEGRLKVCHERPCRSLSGVSMGGYGALKTALRHSQMFASVAVNSPSLLPFNFFDDDDRWKAFWSRHPIGAEAGMMILSGARIIMKDRENADHNDPTWLVENFGDATAMPSLYFDMGNHDEFGFQEGFERFKAALDKRGFPYEAHLNNGEGHHILGGRQNSLLKFLGAKLAGVSGAPR